jgi:CDP-diacylglycerol--serine O-phosphatidyltransferase
MIIRNIPNIITIGNLFVGIIAMIFAMQENERFMTYAAIMIIIGMLLDGLDGRIARLLKVQSDFGKELDSLCDIVTFGVAPALIMYNLFLHDAGWIGIFITAFFPICGALRLARFNTQTCKCSGYFIGLPITAAGGILATLALYYDTFPQITLALGMIGLSLLMISNIKYPNFKRVAFPRSVMIAGFMLVIVAVFAILYPRQFPLVIFVPLVLYVLLGLRRSLHTLFYRRQQDKSDEEMLNS